MHLSQAIIGVLAASTILVAAEPIQFERRGLLKDAKSAVKDVAKHVENKVTTKKTSTPAKPSRDNTAHHTESKAKEEHHASSPSKTSKVSSHHSESKPAKHEEHHSASKPAKHEEHHSTLGSAKNAVKHAEHKVKEVKTKAKQETNRLKDRVSKDTHRVLGKTSAGRKILKDGSKVEKDASKFAKSKTGKELIKGAKIAGKVGEDAAMAAGLLVPGEDVADGALIAAKVAKSAPGMIKDGEKAAQGVKKLDKAKKAYEKTKNVAGKVNDKVNDASNVYYTGQQVKSSLTSSGSQQAQQVQQRRDLDWFEDEFAGLMAREAEYNDELMYTLYLLDQLSY